MFHFIVNPASKSGHGHEVWDEVEQYLKDNSIPYRVYFSKRIGHVQQLVADVFREYYDGSDRLNIVIMGGDGTFNEAIQGVPSFDRVNIGYIPTGSGNDFAKAIGYSKDPVENAKRVINCKKPQKFDIGRLKFEQISDERSKIGKGSIAPSRYFNVSCGIGFDAAICEEALDSKLKHFLNLFKLGKLAYALIAVKQIFGAKLCDVELIMDGAETLKVKNCRFVVGMNTCYEGGGLKFAPSAVPNDGYLDICLIEDISKLGAILTIPSATKGNHVKNKKIHIYRAKQYEVISADPLWVHTDGEVHTKSNHIKVSLLNGGMNFLW